MSNPPLRAGERHQAAITGCNHQGQGVARVDGFAVFVPGAIPGELVAFTIVQVKARYALAELAEVLEPSPARQVPPCPVYGICGGCQFQHVRYSLQLELKHELVADALRRLGGTEAPVAPTLGMEYPWCYRNHGQFHVAFVQGRNRLGFHAPRTHQVVPAESCPLFSPAVNRILRFVASHPDANTPPAAGPGGSWRRLAVRESLSSGQHLLVFETVDRRWHPGPLAEAVAAAFPSVTSVFWRPAVTGRGQHGRCELVFGGPFLREVLNGLSFRISAESFMQVNTRQAATLFALVREVAALQ
ncbi:MAG: TRAM domain-containing protein, partial [Syntrophomonadaceae bacterium]|nr:TRAM domain-containing protein [Syntrophomonadaceae bacterium]